jgi:hypothetical protein
MAKWIKNADIIDNTWVGQLIPAGTYYEIQQHEEFDWANNSSLLADIGSGKAIVAKDSSGTNDIVDINEAINYLKDNLPKDVKISESATISGVKDPAGMRARLVGIINSTITAGQTVDLDWLCPQLSFDGVNKKSYFDGIEYYAKNGNIGDKATFQVVDKDGIGVLVGWYTQAQFDAMGNLYVVEEFGEDWYMIPDALEHLMLYKAAIVPGLYIRMKYTSTGSTNVDIVVNLFRHLNGLEDA